MKRACGYLPRVEARSGVPVWARAGVAVEVCPKSYITGESLAWIEHFGAFKFLGCTDPIDLPARTVDALCLIKDLVERESTHGQQRNG